MSKFLKRLLANDHPLFLMNVALLERATGNAGIDARLVGDITAKGHQVIRKLKLDPSDTTERELYQALGAVYRRDPVELESLLSGSDYVIVNLGLRPISLNYRDLADSIDQRLSYEKSSVAHAQRQLRIELVRRYAEHERTHDDMVYGLTREIGVLVEEASDEDS